MQAIRRWDAKVRESTYWNDLRKDPELWFENGDCFVFLFQQGRSQRGPSFRIPLVLLELAQCRKLLETSLISQCGMSPFPSYSAPASDSFLFLHAPDNTLHEAAYRYHITTRNFFAWLTGTPLVASDPVSAVLDLKERMDLWRDDSVDNLTDLHEYMKSQGYSNVLNSDEMRQDINFSASEFFNSGLAQNFTSGPQLPPQVPLRTSSKRQSGKSSESLPLGKPRRTKPIKTQVASTNWIALRRQSDETFTDRMSINHPLFETVDEKLQSPVDESDPESIFSRPASPASSSSSSIPDVTWLNKSRPASRSNSRHSYQNGPGASTITISPSVHRKGSNLKAGSADGSKTEAIIDVLLENLGT